jgi:hypothetical protein
MVMLRKQVLLYELNEVPWLVIDRFMQRCRGTQLAETLRCAQTFTTLCNDPNPLEPWRSWPAFHTGLSSLEHRSLDLGQDPTTFGGEPIWDTVARQGIKVGVFGPLQSWPARTYASGGFYVPDTFARSPECVPASLTEVQKFNLRLTRENLFSADAPLPVAAFVDAPLTLLRAGMRLCTFARLVQHVCIEALDARHKAGRSMMQAEPMFDIFMRQMQVHDPRFGIFFTNHVAGMMHRFWADAMESFGEKAPYAVDGTHADLIWKAMRIFDRHLRELVKWVHAAEDRVVMVASSMGQAPIPYRSVERYLVVREAPRLLNAIGCRPAEVGLAMYPAYSLKFRSDTEADAARARLCALRIEGQPLFQHFRRAAATLRFEIVSPASTEVGLVNNDAGSAFTLEDLGIVARERLGGANTAHHVPEGALFVFGAGVTADPSRREIDSRAVRARILDTIGCKSDSVITALAN